MYILDGQQVERLYVGFYLDLVTLMDEMRIFTHTLYQRHMLYAFPTLRCGVHYPDFRDVALDPLDKVQLSRLTIPHVGPPSRIHGMVGYRLFSYTVEIAKGHYKSSPLALLRQWWQDYIACAEMLGDSDEGIKTRALAMKRFYLAAFPEPMREMFAVWADHASENGDPTPNEALRVGDYGPAALSFLECVTPWVIDRDQKLTAALSVLYRPALDSMHTILPAMVHAAPPEWDTNGSGQAFVRALQGALSDRLDERWLREFSALPTTERSRFVARALASFDMGVRAAGFDHSTLPSECPVLRRAFLNAILGYRPYGWALPAMSWGDVGPAALRWAWVPGTGWTGPDYEDEP